MKKSRRLLALCMVFLFAASMALTGCGEKPATEEPAAATEQPSNETPASTESEEVVVDIFQFKVEIAKELQNAAKDFEAENPGIKINIQTVGGGDDYGAALRTTFQSGNEPDIYNVGGPQDVEDWMSKLEDLSDQPWVDLVQPGLLNGATVEGKVYALPFAVEGYGFAYNKAIFEAAGIKAEDINSYDALETAVKELDKKIKAGELKGDFPLLEAVFELPAKETWVTGLHASNVAIAQELDSSITAFNAKELEFKHSKGLKALIDLQAKYSASGDATERLNAVDYATQVDEGLAIERVAIIQQGNWIYGGVNDIDENVAANLAFLPMPIKGAKEDSIPVGIPMHWAVNSKSPEADKEAAKKFLAWLYTSDTGKDYVVNKFFFIPPLKGFDGLEPKDPLAVSINNYVKDGKIIPWVFMGYPTSWGMDVLGADIQKYLGGQMTWEELEKDVIAKWTELR